MKFYSVLGVIAVLSLAGAASATLSVPLTIDTSQSDVDVTISVNSTPQLASSSLSGTAVVVVDPSSSPFSTARLTDISAMLNDAMNFNFGLIVVDTAAGDVGISLIEPNAGSAGAVAADMFSQTGNNVSLSGDAVVTGIINDTFDLADQGLVTVDFNNVSIVQVGDVLTISAPLNVSTSIEVENPLGGTIPVDIDIRGQLVAIGIIPEPASLALLGLGGMILIRRRRR